VYPNYKAIVSCKRTIVIDPEYPEVYLLLSGVFVVKGEIDLAIASLNQAIGIDSDCAAAHCSFGNIYVCGGEADLAIASYKRAIAIETDFEPTLTGICYHDALTRAAHCKGCAMAHCGLGTAVLLKLTSANLTAGNMDLAIASFKRAIAIDPECEQAQISLTLVNGHVKECSSKAYRRYNLGLAHKRKGEADLAIASYKQAIAIDPELVIAHRDLGTCYHTQGEHDLAIASYNRAIAIDSNDAMAHCGRGTSHSAKGDYDLAIASHKQAITINPWCAIAHCNLGASQAKSNEDNLAIASYKRAIVINPKFTTAHINLGSMYLTNGDFDLAIASLQQANAIEPWNELAQQMLARALQSRPTLTHFDTIPSGAKVVIRGLVKFAIHNGKHATIQGFDRDKGRYNLLSEDGKVLNVKPQNLLQLIRHCVITGMKSTGRSFNGRQGDIQAWDEVKGWYIMRFGTACGCFIPGACVQFEVRLVHTCILPDHSFFLHFPPPSLRPQQTS
jgi:tetratricopeptide (TPR) repeat protein